MFDDRTITYEAGGQTVVASAALNLVPEEDILIMSHFLMVLHLVGEGSDFRQLISDATPEKITITADTITPTTGDCISLTQLVTFPSDYPRTISGLEPCIVKMTNH